MHLYFEGSVDKFGRANIADRTIKPAVTKKVFFSEKVLLSQIIFTA